MSTATKPYVPATEPYDFRQASEADREAHETQRAAEQFVIDCARKLAEAERVYRKALAEKMLTLKAEGTAWTSCGDIARGDPAVAKLRYERDVASGVKEAAWQATWRASKNRDAEALRCQWSMRRDLAEGYHPPTGEGETYGGRRAA